MIQLKNTIYAGNNMKVGTLVHIVKQPPNQCVQLKGERGYILELHDKFATVHSFSLGGKPYDGPGGQGAVPLDCLQEETDSLWIEHWNKWKGCNALYL